MMPLMFANPGDEVIIKKVGGSAETKKHLEDSALLSAECSR